MPGTPGTKFKQFYGIDTDGQTVSFGGVTALGQFSGVFTAPVGSNGQGPITKLAVTGEMSPFGLPYLSGGFTAITPDAVFFEAGVGTATSQKYAVLVACGEDVHAVFKSGDVIAGKKMLDGRICSRAADGKDLVMWARYEDPAGPFGVNTMLLHVHVECPGGCYADCDGSGSLDFFDFLCFQNEFAAGATYADCNGSGSLDFFDFLCFQNKFSAGCP